MSVHALRQPGRVQSHPAAQRAPVLIDARSLEQSYALRSGQHVKALNEVSLQVSPGEFVCLLGPSGCGKTTLLNMIAGFLQPTAGRLLVGDEPVSGPSPDRGVVFQDYSLFPWLTVQANVEFGLRMKGGPGAQRREVAQRQLAMVGLEGAGRRYPFELSGGMKQRVAIARALATDPELLLMDEPFAALDAMTRGSLQQQLIDIHAQTGKTVIFVTHNISEAIFLASRIVVMSDRPGRITHDISLADVPRPRKRSTAAFSELYEELAQAIGGEGAE